MTSELSRIKNKSFVLILLPIIFIPVVLYSTTLAMIHVWSVNETFTHSFLVFPFVFWLMWQKRLELFKVEPDPEPRALLLLVLLLTGWLISAAVDVEIVQQFCMISIILTTIWIIAGRRLMSYVFFPLMFLYFAVPFGQVFIPPLMEFTADFTVTLIQMVGIPVHRDGLSFSLSSGSWSVVEECSGVRYLIASFLLGSIYAYLNYSSTKKRVVFILLSLVLPIIGNSLRAFGIVMIGHFSGMKLAIGADHLLYGWVFFGIIIFLLFYAGSFWRDNEESFDKLDDGEQVIVDGQKAYSPFIYLIITFFLVAAFSAFSNNIENKKQENIESVSLQIPVQFSAWQYEIDRLFNWQPVYLNPDVKISRGYSLADDFVQLNIAYYQVQRRGAEAVSTSNKITDPYGGQWKLISTADVLYDGKHFTESELKYADKKILVWSWYQVGEYETPSPYIAKALEAYNLIVKGRSDVSVLSIATQFDDTKKATRQTLHDFWKKSAKYIIDEFETMQNEK